MNKKSFTLLAALVLVSIFLAACGGAKNTPQSQAAMQYGVETQRAAYVAETAVAAASATKPPEMIVDLPIGKSMEIRVQGSVYLINFTQVVARPGQPIEVVLNGRLFENGDPFPVEYNGTFLNGGWIQIVPPVVQNSLWTVRFHIYKEFKVWMGALPTLTEQIIEIPANSTVVYTIQDGDTISIDLTVYPEYTDKLILTYDGKSFDVVSSPVAKYSGNITGDAFAPGAPLYLIKWDGTFLFQLSFVDNKWKVLSYQAPITITH